MTLDAKHATTLRLTQRYAAPVARVFEAWTRPEVMSRWMSPRPESPCHVTADVRPGGRYRIEMKNAMEGADYIAIGVYEEIVPNRRLVFTWSWEGNPALAENTLVTVEFEAQGGGTALTLTHERFAGVEQRNNHSDGWTACLSRLDAALEV